MRLLVMASLLSALLLGGLAVTAGATGSKHDKTKLCHVTGSQTIQISVSDNAVSAHLRHGDSKPDEYGDCPGGGNGGDGGHDHGGGNTGDGNNHDNDYWWRIRYWQWFFWQLFWGHFGHFA